MLQKIRLNLEYLLSYQYLGGADVGNYTILIVKPNFYMDEVWQYIQEVMQANGFTCHYEKRMHLTKVQAKKLYGGLVGEDYAKRPVQFIINGRVIVSVWYHPEDAIALAKKLVGPTYADKAKLEDCIRGYLLNKFGCAQEPFYNAANFVHVPSTEQEMADQSQAVLGRAKASTYICPAA